MDTYIVVGINEEGKKIKMTPKDLIMDEEDMRPAEQYGPEFIKRNQNSNLYKAHSYRSCINTIKVNAWARDYKVNLSRAHREHMGI